MSNNIALSDMVHRVLKYIPETRNSDVLLTSWIWKKFFPDKVNNDMVNIHDLFVLPREDDIKRLRAKIQNELKLFLPTDFKVVERRRWKRKNWETSINKKYNLKVG